LSYVTCFHYSTHKSTKVIMPLGVSEGAGLTLPYIFGILVPWYLESSWPWRDCPFQDKPIPRHSKQLIYKHILQTQTNSSRATPYPQQPSLLMYYTQAPIHPLYHPRPDTRQLGIVPVPEDPLKTFKVANSKSAYLASSIPPCRNHSPGSCS
jgi:hypothetical protein